MCCSSFFVLYSIFFAHVWPSGYLSGFLYFLLLLAFLLKKTELLSNSRKWFMLRIWIVFVCTKRYSKCGWYFFPCKLDNIKKMQKKWSKNEFNSLGEQFVKVEFVELQKVTFSFLRFSIFSVSLCSASSLIFLFCSLHSSNRCAISFLSTSVLNKEEQTKLKRKGNSQAKFLNRCT